MIEGWSAKTWTVIPRLYAITDCEITGMTHAEQVRRLAAGGVQLIQLREKAATSRQFYHSAKDAVSTARQLGVRVIINDRVDIALAVAADGVHLGQDDMPADRARDLLGSGRLIGLSTHSVDQASEAADLPIDYIAVGPVYPTSTKPDHTPVVGLELVRQTRQAADKPLVAIGGITLRNAPEVIRAGADAVAVISGILRAEDISQRAGEFFRLLQHPGP